MPGAANDNRQLCRAANDNAYHQPTLYKDAATQVWNLSYNGNRQLTSLTDPLNNLTQLFYDGATQRLWKVRNANLLDAQGQAKNYGYGVDDSLAFTAYTNPAPGSVATPG